MVTNNIYHFKKKKNKFLFQNNFFPFDQKNKKKCIWGVGMQQG